MPKYYSLTTLSSTPCNVNKVWHKKVLEEWICSRCYNVYSKKLKDILLSEDPDNAPLNIIHGVDVGVISHKLITIIGENFVERYLELGNLLGNDKIPNKEFLAFRGKESRLLIRGNEDSNYGNCPVCNRFDYYPRGKWYLVDSDIGGSPLYQSQFGLIIRDDICKLTELSKTKKLSLREIPVKSIPLDNLDLPLN